MPASPVTEEQLYNDSDECCQIQQPTTEYSKLLGKPITLRKRLKAFRSAVDHVIKLKPKTTFNVCDLRSTHPDTPTALVADGLAIEIMVTTNASRTTLQVDLHEEWRQIMTGSSFAPDNVEVLLGPNGFKTHLIIASGTHTFDTAKCGTVMSLKLKKSTVPHATVVKFTGCETFKQKTLQCVPPNGQLWTFPLAPSVLVLAPFCFTRGWTCLTCNKAFDSPFEYVRHAIHNPALSNSSIVLNRIDLKTGNQIYTSAAMPRYPVRRPQFMAQHAYVGFKYSTAIEKLLSLRRQSYS